MSINTRKRIFTFGAIGLSVLGCTFGGAAAAQASPGTTASSVSFSVPLDSPTILFFRCCAANGGVDDQRSDILVALQ